MACHQVVAKVWGYRKIWLQVRETGIHTHTTRRRETTLPLGDWFL